MPTIPQGYFLKGVPNARRPVGGRAGGVRPNGVGRFPARSSRTLRGRPVPYVRSRPVPYVLGRPVPYVRGRPVPYGAEEERTVASVTFDRVSKVYDNGFRAVDELDL